jgi:TM2 domain-containing membrane protein YozV
MIPVRIGVMIMYLKKLGTGIVYLLLLILIFAVIYSVAGSLIPGDTIGWVVSIGLASLGLTKIVMIRRSGQTVLRSRYLTDLARNPFCFTKDLLYILKHKVFKTELAVHITLVFPLSLLVALRENQLDLMQNILWGLFFFVACIAILSFYNIVIWLVIHQKWAKENLHNPEEV